MSADRLLSILLRSLQTYTTQQDTHRIIGTASSLLSSLGNPHNLNLLTAHLLTAPAFWSHPEGLHSVHRLLSVFHTAAAQVVLQHNEVSPDKAAQSSQQQLPLGSRLTKDEWIRAVVAGADERSQRWKHLIVLGGLMTGLASMQDGSTDNFWSSRVQERLEVAFITATNLALAEVREQTGVNELGAQTITLILNHSFTYIDERRRGLLAYDQLLPVLIGSAYFSAEGFQSAYFLGGLSVDVRRKQSTLTWDARSASYRQIEAILASPLVSSMGPLSRLIAHAVGSVKDPYVVQTMVEDLLRFSRALLTQWRQISSFDTSQDVAHGVIDISADALPLLWRLLRSVLFSITAILSSTFNRALRDNILASDVIAPVLASEALHILRHLYFITSRLGAASFTQHTFVYLSAIDTLSQYSIHAHKFLESIAPEQLGNLPFHALDRVLDLFFLDTAEHFTLTLSPQFNEDFLLAAAIPYLRPSGNRDLLLNFEAAHSVVLAVLSAPQSVPLATEHLPFYVDALLGAFPQDLSSRQFRLAFKTLMRSTVPPAPLSVPHPDLPVTLLELVFHRASTASAQPLSLDEAILAVHGADAPLPPMSEQVVLALSLVDVLPHLPILLLEEWLPLCADLLHRIQGPGMQELVKQRFWEVLVSGEMDTERGSIAAAWWTSRGGRDSVLFHSYQDEDTFVMSGALPLPGSQPLTRL